MKNGWVRRLAQRPRALALAGYVTLVAVFFAPLLSGAYTYPDGDFTRHFLPFSLLQRGSLLARRLPLYNPYTYSGHPFLADIQAAVFYPIGNVLLLLSLPWSSLPARLYALQLEAALHFVLAAAFTYLLVRDLTGDAWAAFGAGCAFAFSGYLTGYPPLQLAILRTAVWLPLILWLVLRAARRVDGPGRLGDWLWVAAAHAVAFLAGHPQTFLFLSYVVAAWIAVLFVATGRLSSLRRLRHGAAELGLYVGGLLALTLAQLWPSLEFTRLSVRAQMSYAELSGGFPLADTWQLLFPGTLTHFSPLYVGVTALGLALAATLWLAPGLVPLPLPPQPGRDHGSLSPPAGVLFFGGVGLIALLLSYGANGFLYPLFYRYAPGWNLFRGQERAAYLVAFSLSVLAGYGLTVLARVGPRRRRVVALGYALPAALALVVFALLWQRAGRTDVSPIRFAAIAALFVVFLGLYSGVLWTRRGRRGRASLLVGLIVADLFLVNYTTNLEKAPRALQILTSPAARATREAVDAGDEGTSAAPGRVYNEYRVPEDAGMVMGWEDVWGSSPLRLAPYAALFDDFPLDRMWRLTGVEHVLTWRRELFVPSTLLAEFPQAADTTYLHRLEHVEPRVWLAHRVRLADAAAAKALLADHNFDLRGTLLVAEEFQEALPPELLDDGGDRVETETGAEHLLYERLGPARWRIHVRTGAAGLLFVSENWLPGWRATLLGPDGERAALPVVRAHLAFLGIPVPGGETTVELVYRPRRVLYGLGISAAAWALVVAIGVWRLLRRARRRGNRA